VQLLRKLGHPHAPTDVGAGHARLHHDRLSFFARQRLPEAALHCLAVLDSLNPFLCRLDVDDGVRGACFAIGDSSLGGTDDAFVPSIVSVCTRRSPSQKR
jgi:hypothetical protein